ncbi:hypothetical protein ACLBXM_17815 [Xanthobacteraceae bacterium A53D]
MKPKSFAERTAIERRLIGSHVRQVRLQRNKPKAAIMARLEISEAELDALENGEREFTALQIFDLADFFPSTLGFLLGGGYPERTRFPVHPAAADPFALDVAAVVSTIPTPEAKAEALEAVHAILSRFEPEAA